MRATAKVPPLPWQPSSSSGLMTNDLTGSSPEETVPCFAVSKNDSCLLSASGGRISLYSLLEFKWSPGDFGAPISHATFSCDGQMVHASFEDGVVSIFDAPAQMYCLVFSSTQTTMADHWSMLLSYNDPPPLLTMTFSDGARNGKQGKGN
ncbi:PROTEIN putative-RELATED [Salix viminalis]|uniref:PROTEIN putative-RELATED n=1 Tax=Salix viminalis TaxID=40686 RepID=A0A9Q0V9S5_SALVM|nr:PROTEIN putative-RELATED [Salix viminalis]